MILIDDGSTDSSSIICDKYNKADNRVKVIHKINEGVSKSRNLGISISKGEFIMFVDPDDELKNDAVEYLYKLIKLYNCDIACYKMEIYKNNELKTNITNINEKIDVYNGSEIISEHSSNGTFLHSSCNKLYNRKLVGNNRFNENIRYAEDALFNFNVLSDSKRLVMSNLSKYNYFINEGSTVTKVNEKRVDILIAQCEIFKLLKNRYNKYTENITRDFIKSSISIVIDMANKNEKNKEVLIRLRKAIKENKYMLDDMSLVTTKDKFLFNIINMNPNIILFLYIIRFNLKKILKKGRL